MTERQKYARLAGLEDVHGFDMLPVDIWLIVKSYYDEISKTERKAA